MTTFGCTSAQGEDVFGKWVEFEYKRVVQRMRWIPPGKFLMGSPETELYHFENETQHEVIFTEGYWLADTACTQELWVAVMGDTPSNFQGSLLPVESVDWDDCQKFLSKLNKEVPELDLRLPTEAEWEYACRAGTTTPFSFGENITTAQVNYDGGYSYADGVVGEYRAMTVPVKSLPPNPWGLFEMHGNVWEWCEELYSAQGYRVVRGGSWYSIARYVRSAHRNRLSPSIRFSHLGFRFARGLF